MRYGSIILLPFLLFSFACVGTSQPVKEKEVAQQPIAEPLAPEEDLVGLKDVFKDYFLIGAAVSQHQVMNEPHARLLKKHYSSITAEDIMKPESLQPREGVFTFRGADILVNFALENGIAMRGHTLVWHSQTPGWFFVENGAPASKEKLKERLRNHIFGVMEHYKGKVYAWDVVNEAVDPDQPDGFRKSKWFEILGEEYIELAFRYAREADPKCKLIYNDYSMEDARKRQAVLALIKKLRAKGVPIDGIGSQMHISLYKPSLYEFETAMQEMSALGLEIHITELDISVYATREQSFKTVSRAILTEQGHHVKDLFTVMRKYKKNLTGVTFWGLADDWTWLERLTFRRENWPLPFDERLKAKPFYWGMVDPDKLATRIKKANTVKGTPQIDGVEDPAWNFAEFVPQLAGAPDLSAQVKTMWDEKYLYVIVKTLDKTPLQNDGLTIFLDETNNQSAAMDNDDSAVEYGLKPGWKDTENAAAAATPTGYIVETRLPLKDIKATQIKTIGFDVMIKNGEKTIISWNDNSIAARRSPADWGSLIFVDAPKGNVARYGTPVVDGRKDEKYASAHSLPVALFIQGLRTEENKLSGATAQSWVLWDEKALYVYTEVLDKHLSVKNSLEYMQDSIEIFLDENNNKTNYYDKDDGQFRVNLDNRVSYGSTGEVKGLKSAARITETGYAVEIKIPFKALKAQDGAVIGFDLQVNDDQGSGARDSIAKWNDPTNDSWQSTAGFGVLVLQK